MNKRLTFLASIIYYLCRQVCSLAVVRYAVDVYPVLLQLDLCKRMVVGFVVVTKIHNMWIVLNLQLLNRN